VILGGIADGTVEAISNKGSLSPYPSDAVHQDKHIDALKERMVAYTTQLHKGLEECGDSGDEETADLLTGVSRGISKDAWFIGAHHTDATS
jgi:starvation-inducible DNA-binding protein